ncbi:TetR/AcrR family transcriptional regulator [Ruminococcus sp.]|uniref:TetR/AcrR family transcriptional regulator n=1 Tax=Ruminococcus sp. TaxID=41978 RepID=UPI0025E88C03|nr:TetR/AcrR family transcriptional regulator [Ruminococcus sp.]MBQ8967447.1 TetR/AcrR family transcriptional regulator [Ruminococcus sp.]
MSPKIFSIAEKEQLKEKMFLSGLELLKQYGMTHMSVEKIAASAGIGKSTFYNFFMSKEDFVIQLIEFNRSRFWKAVADMLGEREKLSVAESKQVLAAIINDQDSVYQYLTTEDEKKLAAADPDSSTADIVEETETLKRLFLMFEDVREDIDYGVTANLLKILAITAENRYALHESAYERTQEKLFELLYGCIFKEGKNG